MEGDRVASAKTTMILYNDYSHILTGISGTAETCNMHYKNCSERKQKDYKNHRY